MRMTTSTGAHCARTSRNSKWPVFCGALSIRAILAGSPGRTRDPSCGIIEIPRRRGLGCCTSDAPADIHHGPYLNSASRYPVLRPTGFRQEDVVGLGSISDRMANYARWIGEPGVYVCRFEDVVGPAGGGDGVARHRPSERSSAHGRPLPDGEVRSIAARVWNPESHTFRGGRVGGWSDRFADSHRALFKEIAGDWLVKLNYEAGYDW